MIHRKALTILETLSHAESKDADIRYYFGLANESIGRVQMRQAAWADALESERTALATCEQLLAIEPISAKVSQAFGRYLHAVGNGDATERFNSLCAES